jgi:hypothetical protein
MFDGLAEKYQSGQLGANGRIIKEMRIEELWFHSAD